MLVFNFLPLAALGNKGTRGPVDICAFVSVLNRASRQQWRQQATGSCDVTAFQHSSTLAPLREPPVFLDVTRAGELWVLANELELGTYPRTKL